MSGVLGRDVGAGQGAGEPGIFVGGAAGGQRGWMRRAGRDAAGWEGPRGCLGKGKRLMRGWTG